MLNELIVMLIKKFRKPKFDAFATVHNDDGSYYVVDTGGELKAYDRVGRPLKISTSAAIGAANALANANGWSSARIHQGAANAAGRTSDVFRYGSMAANYSHPAHPIVKKTIWQEKEEEKLGTSDKSGDS